MKKRETSRKKIIDGIFTIIAPGTPLRSALNRIQEAELGALILLGKPTDFPGLIGGGFEINAEKSVIAPIPRKIRGGYQPC